MNENQIKIDIEKKNKEKNIGNYNSLRADIVASYNNKKKKLFNNNNIIFNTKDDDFIESSDERFKQKSQLDPINKDLFSKFKLETGRDLIEVNEKLKMRKIYVDLNIQGIEKDKSIDSKDNKIINQRKTFGDNSIRTGQYSLITFLPLAIINQFKIASNWFFLITAIIVSIPVLADKNSTSEIVPFVIVMIISLIKEAAEDYRKYKNDKKANNAKVSIFKDHRFFREKWQNIKVGNMIKIYKDDLIPADVLVVKSSLKSGFCYMQTSNLDGENAIKPREAFNLTQKNIKNKTETIREIFNYKDNNFYIEVLHPNKTIYDIEGSVFYENNKNYFSIKNVLLRGARLKNIDYVYGIVLYNGHDTKLMQNIDRSSLKMSHIDIKLNYVIFSIFIICVIINVVSSALGISFFNSNVPDYENKQNKAEYLFYYRNGEKNSSLEISKIFINYFVFYSTFIPVSIIITNAFSKVIQTIYLQQYTPEYKEDKGDTIKCFSTGLLDELGMVKYIFSDKTGTITKNEMVFRGCSIYNQLFDDNTNNTNYNNDSMMNAIYYNRSFFDIPSFTDNFNSPMTIKKNSFVDSTKATTKPPKLKNSKISENFCLNHFLKVIQNNNNSIIHNGSRIPLISFYEAIEHFFINIVINHDVLIEKNSSEEINFQGTSPDEITLVSAAYEFGFCFISKEHEIITLNIFDKENFKTKKYKILQKFDFTSERQCSSIIVKNLETEDILIYIKGSDKKIFGSIDHYSYANIYPKTKAHLEDFAKKGLRTLCYGFKYIDPDNYKKWEEKYNNLKYKSMQNIKFVGKLNEHIKYIESNIILLGVTALEDKLQKDVEKDIKKFIEAGINFWMITGDKMDTAESIGYSCGIFSEDSEIFKIKEINNEKEVIQMMEDISEKINKINNELIEITNNHHKKMIEKKIIPKDDNFITRRKRFNSLDEKEMALEILSRNKTQRKSLFLNSDSKEKNQIQKVEFQNNNIDNNNINKK